MSEWQFPTPRYHLLDIWMALGGDPLVFEEWMNHPKRTPATAWAQLMCAVAGHVWRLTEDTNPPADQLLDVVLRRLPQGGASDER